MSRVRPATPGEAEEHRRALAATHAPPPSGLPPPVATLSPVYVCEREAPPALPAPPAWRFLAPRHDYSDGRGWSRRVEVSGAEVLLGVERGARKKNPFNGKWGAKWYGFVRRPGGKTLWSAQVPKTLGARGLLAAWQGRR